MWELGLGVFELTGRISAFDQGYIYFTNNQFLEAEPQHQPGLTL